ncbi:L,D-transpeptidase YcbB [Indibacter alkaliphilus LW1]|uniref:L,D-transpeptidase YcbB n=1 Tax=Indibacter alkaliphilus (strain CCUG 57479 / KCTC 22604 / LW1) TaxID=1189612 RepID=S2DC41_INDAL|nr:L,D-transpeptidase family protein [Indibacter alkaliphilus]EOZ96762.1 L,D-transpeptidase YcbB [Indibacter alkaliphilus LW1]
MKNFVTLIFIFITLGISAQDVPVQDEELSNQIRNFLENDSPEEIRMVMGRRLFSSVVMKRFYTSRGFEAAWSEDRKLNEIAYEMRYEIQQSKFDGLTPNDYHLKTINELFSLIEEDKRLGQASDFQALASLDVLLTDAFIMLASHLSLGKVDPEALKTTWNIQRNAPQLRFDEKLAEGLESGRLRKTIEEFYPNLSIYKKMRDGLREMYDFEAKMKLSTRLSWKTLKADKSIKPGENHSEIPEIRKRLIFWGYLNDSSQTDRVYDEQMEDAVKALQSRHGLEPDAVIGRGTMNAINQSPQDLVATASVNLERLRWLPDNVKDQELILVNTANFQLDLILNRDTVLTSRVIVGRSYHSTPQFSAEMSYLVFSPTWTVPNSITRSEIIPAVRKDPSYFQKKNMKLLTSDGTEVNPANIDWNKVNPRSFPYTVRQEPGEQNALGLVKFMFPNKYSVYIHDTPSRSLFAREDRALSHGCIRVQKPFELAKILLSYDQKWTDERIRNAMRQDREQTVLLNRKIPVIILYLTYWSDSKGTINFRNDLYNRDQEVYTALLQERNQ